MPTNPTILQSLNTAVLSDTLDSLGLMQQAMKPFIRPLDDTLQLFGGARTGCTCRCTHRPPRVRTPTRWKSRSSMSSRPETWSCWRATVPPNASLPGENSSPPPAWRVARPDA